MGRKLWYAACALGVAVGVAGCAGGGSSGAASPSASTSASPSASASASATASASPSASPVYSVPAAARVQSEAGAIAFVKFYFEQVNRAWMEPSATLLPPLAHAECGSCANLQADAMELVEFGQRMEPAPVRMSNPQVVPGAPPGQYFIAADIAQTGAKVYDAKGAVVDQDEAVSSRYIVMVTWEEGKWLLRGTADA